VKWSVHSTLHTWHSTLYTLHSTLRTLHLTLYTSHFTLRIPRSTLGSLHFTLNTLHFTLHTLNSTLSTLHPTRYTLHFKLHTFHFDFALYTLHFRLDTPHSTLYTLHTPHSTLHTPDSIPLTLYTLHIILYTWQSTICTINIHVSIRVGGLHLVFCLLATLDGRLFCGSFQSKNVQTHPTTSAPCLMEGVNRRHCYWWCCLQRVWVWRSYWHAPGQESDIVRRWGCLNGRRHSTRFVGGREIAQRSCGQSSPAFATAAVRHGR